MSLIKSIAQHARNYSLASILTTIAGLVSFPILTRVLSIEDYGVMSLIASALTLAVGIGKLGMQHAAMRFYSEVKARKLPGVGFEQFYSTIMLGMALMGLVVTVVWITVALVLPSRLWADHRMPMLMLMTAALILARVVLSGAQNILGAQERSGVLSVMTVVHRYGSLALVLAAVLLIAPTLQNYYLATVFAELGLVAASVWWVVSDGGGIRPNAFSAPLFKSMLAFAVPMSGYELASVVLQLGDRQIQQVYLSTEAVGLYSAAYNLCDYIRLALFAAAAQSVRPIMLRMADEQGHKAAGRFVHRYTHLYICGSLLIIAMLCSVRSEALSILASAKYSPAGEVMPWLIFGMMCEAYFGIAGLGLYLHKRSLVTMSIIAAGAALNMVLNFLLVPRLGIVGSGMSNAASCLGIAIACSWASRGALQPPKFIQPIAKFGLLALAAYVVATRLQFSSAWVTLILRSGVTLFVYIGLVLLVDAKVRGAIKSYGNQFLESRRKKVNKKPTL